MDILVKLTVPNHIYKFYDTASVHIADCTAEDIMADALTAYAGLICEDIARENKSCLPEIPE